MRVSTNHAQSEALHSSWAGIRRRSSAQVHSDYGAESMAIMETDLAREPQMDVHGALSFPCNYLSEAC